MEQTAEIICDSKNEYGQRITTFKLTFWRVLLAEVNTHRMMSRNSASSRAIRFENMVKSVMENPFVPIKWMKDHAGMQGVEYFIDEYLDGNNDALNLQDMWLQARNDMVKKATEMNKYGLTKQICNRLLEPFMYHTCLLTGTEFENFTALRAENMAEIHFQDLAFKMLNAMNESEPKQLKAGEWHIPYGDQFDDEVIWNMMEDLKLINLTPRDVKIKIATTRCARISYLVPDGEQKVDYEADLKLHDRLASSGHMSAFEHCARAMNEEEYDTNIVMTNITDAHINCSTLSLEASKGWCGNFRGFIQYRKMFENENRNDPRLIKK